MNTDTKYPRKATLRYDGWTIPVIVEDEDSLQWQLLLDMDTIYSDFSHDETRTKLRNAYIDACADKKGWGEKYKAFEAAEISLSIYKKRGNALIIFPSLYKTGSEEPNYGTSNSTENVVPLPTLPELSELDRQLKLMADLGYKVKGWDISFPEDGEPHLYASFTK